MFVLWDLQIARAQRVDVCLLHRGTAQLSSGRLAGTALHGLVQQE